MSAHDIRVTTLLTAEEFLALESVVDEEGVSQSAFIRGLLRAALRERALKKLSDRIAFEKSGVPAQLLNN